MLAWNISIPTATAIMKRTRDISAKPRKISNGCNAKYQKEKGVIWQTKSAWYLCSETFESNKTKE
jgi:hypothetical protein